MEQKDTAPHSKKLAIRILSKEELRARYGVKREQTPPAKETEPEPVTVAQHVYTLAHSWQSPRGLEGWQSYRYTRTGENSLKPEDLWRIERGLQHQYTFKSPTEPPRWQFFPLGEQRVVFTRIVPRKQLDRSGQSNIYLAHSLIVPVRELQKLPDGALSLWNDAPYSDSDYLRNLKENDKVDNSGMYGATKSSNLPSRQLDPADLVQGAGRVDVLPKELKKLTQEVSATSFDLEKRLAILGTDPVEDLAWAVVHAKQLVADNRCVTIRGDKKEIEQVLRLAFRLAQAMPVTDETALSFTTFTPGGIPSLTPFWAVGATAPVLDKRAIPIDAAKVLESIKAL